MRHISLSPLAMSGVTLKVAQALDVYQRVVGEGDLVAAEALERAIEKRKNRPIG